VDMASDGEGRMTDRENAIRWLGVVMRNAKAGDPVLAYALQCVNAHDPLIAALREIATHETGSTVGSEYVGTREVTEDCSECDAMQGIAKAALKAAGVQPVSVADVARTQEMALIDDLCKKDAEIALLRDVETAARDMRRAYSTYDKAQGDYALCPDWKQMKEKWNTEAAMDKACAQYDKAQAALDAWRAEREGEREKYVT
jgi:hypothetical protein